MTVSSGVLTVGIGMDYSTWAEACAAIATALTDDLYFLQLGPTSDGLISYINTDLSGHNLVFSCPFPHKGHPRSGLLATFSGAGNMFEIICTDSVGGGTLDIGHLRIKRTGGSSDTAAVIHSLAPLYATPIRHYFHDLILEGSSYLGSGIRMTTGHIHKVWNIKGERFTSGSAVGGALITFKDNMDLKDSQRVENCTACFCQRGFQVETASISVGKFINCCAFDNITQDFVVDSSQLGDGNISKDSSASAFVGESNLWNYDGTINSPDLATEWRSLDLNSYYLRIKEDPRVVHIGGVPSEIDDSTEAIRLCTRANNVGAEGNGRPGSDGVYSRGADEYRELFPAAWTRRVRLFADGSKLEYSWDLPILIPKDAPGMPTDFLETVKAYGDDIRVTTDPEGQHPVPLEVFRFGSDDEDFTIWAGPEIFPETTPVYVWWGNPNASQVPHRGSGPSDSGLDGGAGIWSGASLILHMGNEFDDPTWCFDSSSDQRHPSIESMSSWTASPWLLREGVAANLNGSGRFNVWSVEGVLRNISGVMVTAALSSSVTPSVDTIVEAVRSGVQRFLTRLNQRLVQIDVRAPDSQSPQSLIGSVSFGTLRHRMTARADIDDKQMTIFVDGAVDSDESKSFVNDYLDDTDLDSFSVGRQADDANGYKGYLQEVRVWKQSTAGGWPEAVHQNLDPDRSSTEPFFLPAYAGGSCMPGVRNFKLDVAGSGPFILDNTDFWLSYENDGAGGLSLVLNGIWDKVCPTGALGLARRVELETVVRELSSFYAGLKGTLTIDMGLTSEIELLGAKLINISWEEISNNAGLIYTLEFGLNIGITGGAEFARLLVFGNKALAADNLVIEYVGRDQTQFKPVFRAAPVRIPGGPPIKRVVVSAIVQGLGPGGVAQRRRQAEGIIKDWVDNYLGQEALLIIDGQGSGIAHLEAVRPGILELPEAVGFDLTFVIEYGS